MRIATIICLFASAQAFTVAPHARMTTKLQLMSQEETERIMSKADSCVEGECSLDEIDDLISLLKEQQKELYDRVSQIKDMVKTLETVNSASGKERSVDEIRETVRAIFRVFQLGDKASGNDYPALSKPTGWSGEVGKGAQTAYDVLPPKPMKKSP